LRVLLADLVQLGQTSKRFKAAGLTLTFLCVKSLLLQVRFEPIDLEVTYNTMLLVNPFIFLQTEDQALRVLRPQALILIGPAAI
jgi:hypothetical protein